MIAITKDVATAEVNKWLDFKKLSDRKKEQQADSITALANAFEDGVLVLDEKFNIIHTLKFEIGEESKIKALTYVPRLNLGVVKQNMSGVKATDVDGRIAGYVAALTGQPKAVIDKMDTEDYSIAQAVAVFFL